MRILALLLLVSAHVAVAHKAAEGYLGGRQLLDLTMIPSPPAAGSAAQVKDRETYKLSISEVGGKRWKAAVSQLYLSKPAAMSAQIACAVGAPVDPGNAPILFAMLRKLVTDAVPDVDAIKGKYQRPRPFVGVADFKACDPRVNATDVKSYSYPSGHATIGMLWGDALAAAAPERQAQAEAWGASIGNNRLACRVHWASDVAAGQEIGDLLFEQIAATPGFKADIVRIRSEIAVARGAQAIPLKACN